MTRARAFKLVPPRVPEAALHQQIARVLSLEIAAPGRLSPDEVVWWSVDIASYGGKVPGLRTSRGVIAGIPDLIVVYNGHAYFIELKAQGGALSEEQRIVGTAILRSGGAFGVAKSVEGVLRLLDVWKIPRSRRLRIAAKEA